MKIDEACDDREPGAAGLTGDEALPEIEDAANPEKLAGDKDQEQCEDQQIKKIGLRDQECGKSKDQEQNDRAPMNDDAPANEEKTGGHVRDNSNTVISGRAPSRMGGPVVPMPRLTYSCPPGFSYHPLT